METKPHEEKRSKPFKPGGNLVLCGCSKAAGDEGGCELSPHGVGLRGGGEAHPLPSDHLVHFRELVDLGRRHFGAALCSVDERKKRISARLLFSFHRCYKVEERVRRAAVAWGCKNAMCNPKREKNIHSPSIASQASSRASMRSSIPSLEMSSSSSESSRTSFPLSSVQSRHIEQMGAVRGRRTRRSTRNPCGAGCFQGRRRRISRKQFGTESSPHSMRGTERSTRRHYCPRDCRDNESRPPFKGHELGNDNAARADTTAAHFHRASDTQTTDLHCQSPTRRPLPNRAMHSKSCRRLPLRAPVRRRPQGRRSRTATPGARTRTQMARMCGGTLRAHRLPATGNRGGLRFSQTMRVATSCTD